MNNLHNFFIDRQFCNSITKKLESYSEITEGLKSECSYVKAITLARLWLDEYTIKRFDYLINKFIDKFDYSREDDMIDMFKRTEAYKMAMVVYLLQDFLDSCEKDEEFEKVLTKEVYNLDISNPHKFAVDFHKKFRNVTEYVIRAIAKSFILITEQKLYH